MEITGQDWGLALLFSVEPTDRALAGWCGLTGNGRYLRSLAEASEPPDYCTCTPEQAAAGPCGKRVRL